MTPDPAIATAADYADALMSARRGKNILLLLLLLFLIAQIALFFCVRYDVLKVGTTSITVDAGSAGSASVAATQPSRFNPVDLLHYVVSAIAFLGMIFAIVLSLVLLLLTGIMLVGRLIGVGRMTSAFLWSLLIVLLFFPWQAFLNNANFNATPEFKIPGVFYTWEELAHPTAGAHFSTGDAASAILKWTRFVVFPLVSLIILLAIQVKSNRGLRQALGEETYTSDTVTETETTTVRET